MKTIRKYPFGSSVITAPTGKVLLVDYQSNGTELPTIWIEHELDAPLCTYVSVPTGMEFSSGDEHVGSAICGRYVWHVYRAA